MLNGSTEDQTNTSTARNGSEENDQEVRGAGAACIEENGNHGLEPEEKGHVALQWHRQWLLNDQNSKDSDSAEEAARIILITPLQCASKHAMFCHKCFTYIHTL